MNPTLPDALAEVLPSLLKDIEFAARGYCPRCHGWNPKGQGETPGRHTKDCDLKAAIDALNPIVKGE